jgi:hypothetical protein
MALRFTANPRSGVLALITPASELASDASATAAAASASAASASASSATASAAAAAASASAAALSASYDTKADVEAANIAAPITHLRIAGYTTVGDGGEALYIRVGASEPSHGGKIQSDDGDWWEISRTLGTYRIEQFGGGTGVANNKTAFDIFLGVMGTGSGELLFGKGTYTFTAQVLIVLTFADQHRIAIRGLGSDITVLKWTSATGGIRITQNSTRNSYAVTDLALSTTQNGGGTALDIIQNDELESLMSCDLRNLSIRGSDQMAANVGNNYWSTAISVFNGSFVNYDAINIWGPATPAGNGIVIRGTNSTTQSALIHNLSKCFFWYLNIGLLYDQETQGVTVSACNFFGNNAGILVSGVGDVQLNVHQSLFENVSYGIVINGLIADVMVASSLFFVRADAVGINIDGGLRYTITGNSFVGTSLTNSYGVHVVSNEATNTGTIVGNSYQAMAGANLFDLGTSGFNVQSNAYNGNTADSVDNGTNTLGGGSP